MLLWLELLVVNILLSRLIEKRRWRVLTVVHAVCFSVIFVLMLLTSASPVIDLAVENLLGPESTELLQRSLRYAAVSFSLTTILAVSLQLLAALLLLLESRKLARCLRRLFGAAYEPHRHISFSFPCACEPIPAGAGREICTRNCRWNC